MKVGLVCQQDFEQRRGGTDDLASAYLLVDAPVMKVFLSTFQADLSSTPLFHDEV